MSAGPLKLGEPRLATQADRETLIGLWLDLIDHHKRLDPNYPAGPMMREVLRRELDRGLSSAHCQVLVCGDEDGGLEGFVFAEIDEPDGPLARRGNLQELYVVPARRRSGLGSRLVEAAFGFFERAGVELMTVRAEAGNAEALAFWEAKGFLPRAYLLERREQC